MSYTESSDKKLDAFTMTSSSPAQTSATDGMSLAAKVAAAANIADVRLIKSATSLEEIDFNEATAARTVIGHGYTRDPARDAVVVFCALRYECANESAESKANPPLVVDATFALTYLVTGLAAFTDDELEAFSKLNGMFNAWPFWREFLASSISRMNAPPVTAPTFRVQTEKSHDDQGGTAKPT